MVIFLPNAKFLFLYETLLFEKFEEADFPYAESLSKLQPKENQIRHFSSQSF